MYIHTLCILNNDDERRLDGADKVIRTIPGIHSMFFQASLSFFFFLRLLVVAPVVFPCSALI